MERRKAPSLRKLGIWAALLITLVVPAVGVAQGIDAPKGVTGDLSLTLSSNPMTAAISSTVNYNANVSFTTTATGDASMVQVNFFATPGMSYQGVTGAGWSCSGSSVVSCQLAGTIPAGTASAFSVQYQMPASAQTVQLQGSASYIGVDTNTSNNSATAMTQVQATGASLGLQFGASATTVDAGDPVTYTAQVSNAGPGDATGITLNGAINGPLSISSFSGTGWNCSGGSVSYNCSFSGDLIVGNATPNLTINALAGPGAGSASISTTANSPDAPSPVTQSLNLLVNGSPLLRILKTDSIDPVPLGERFSYMLTVFNDGSGPATGVSISDSLPSEVDFVLASGTGWSCNGSALVQCNLSGNLNPGASATVRIDVEAAEAGLVTNTATAISSGKGGVSDSEATTIIDRPSLSFTKSAERSQVTLGESVDFTLSVRNNGTSAVSGLRISDRLPASLSFVSASGGGWTCISNTVINCSNPALPAGTASTLVITAQADGPAGAATNSATLTFGSDGFSLSASASVVLVEPNAPPDLVLIKTDSADPVTVATNFSYMLNVSNRGGPAANLQLIDNLPPGITFVSASGTGWNCNGAQSVICTFSGTLQTGVATDVTINVTAPDQATELVNAATVSVADEANPEDNTDTETTTITGSGGGLIADLSISGSADPGAGNVGDTVNINLLVSNAGPNAASSVRIGGSAGSELQLGSASGSGLECSVDGGSFSCIGAGLASGATTSVVLSAQLVGAAGSTAELLANVSSTTGDTNSENNQTQVSVRILAPTGADLALLKTDSMDPVIAGEQFSYNLTVSNAGPASAEGVRIVDPLPEGLSLVSASGAGFACIGDSTVTCTATESLAVGQSLTATVTVTAPDQATELVNTATVSAANEVNPQDNTATETTMITAAGVLVADLSISGSADPASGNVGDTVSINLLANNSGPDAASNVRISGSAGSGLQLVSAISSGSDCAVDGSSFSCVGVDLAAGANSTVVLSAQLVGAAGSTTALLANVNSATSDPVAENNQTRVSVGILAPTGADLALLKTDSMDPVNTGEQFSYNLTVSNTGPASAEGVRIVDPLPQGLTLISASGAGFACSGDSTVSCNATGPLAVGQSLTATLTVTAPDSEGSLENVAEVFSTTADGNTGNNRASQTTQIDQRDEGELEGQIRDLIVDDPVAAAAAGPVAQICADPNSAFALECGIVTQAVDDGRAADVAEALRAFSPNEVVAQAGAMLQMAKTQFFNVDARLAELRGGGGGFSLSGLTVVSGGKAVPLSLFSGLLDSDEPEIGGSGDLISPWGFFINGTISRGDQDLGSSDLNALQDFDSYGLTAGVDYRINTRGVVGAALGYTNFESSLVERGGLETTGVTLTGYGSYYVNDRFYVDARLSYNWGDLDQDRRIRFGSGANLVDRRATGSTDSNQLTFAAGAGVHYNAGPWIMTPNGFLRYVRSSINGFSESGAGAFNATYGDQDATSLQLGFGLQVTRAFSVRNGVISPQFDINFVHESKADDLLVQAQLAGADPSVVFQLRADEPDSSFGNVGLGFVYVTANGRQAYLQYREDIGQDGLNRGTLNFGARFEF